jgi:HD superfamily phosphohydrolase YqeK
MILEGVASKNLRIWHAFFGTTGSQNDINVLNKSPLFIEAIRGEAPTVNGNQYDMGYYLADKIYPEWAAFVKTVNAPQSAEDKLFSQRQESVRKDVEKAFGVLQARFDIVRRPARLWKQADVINIMQACVILHNMIVEDEKDAVTDVLDLNDNR